MHRPPRGGRCRAARTRCCGIRLGKRHGRRTVVDGAGKTTTGKSHLLHIYAKLGVNDRAAAVATAFSRGYLTP